MKQLFRKRIIYQYFCVTSVEIVNLVREMTTGGHDGIGTMVIK